MMSGKDMTEEDDWTVNPFADPSIQNVTARPTDPLQLGPARIPSTSVDDMNPFAPGARTISASRPAGGKSPAPPSPKPAHASTRPGGVSVSFPDSPAADVVSQRERELAAREAELARQRAQLEARERELERKATTMAGRVVNEPNWPPFPPGLPMPFQPWYYHNIQEEIPLVNQGDTFRMYQLWKYHCLCYAMNVMAAFSGLFCATCEHNVANVFAAVFYAALAIPLSFRLWYFTLYNGFKDDSAAAFMVFFFVFGFQILANIYFALGFFGTGACGWVAAIKTIHYSWFIGLFFILSAGMWTGAIGLCVMMIIRIHAWYKGTELTLDRAQNEMYNSQAGESFRNTVTTSLLSNVGSQVGKIFQRSGP